MQLCKVACTQLTMIVAVTPSSGIWFTQKVGHLKLITQLVNLVVVTPSFDYS